MTERASTSIKTIQRRLILILVRSFLIVTAAGMLALIGFTIFSINRNTARNPFYRDPNATILEAYYMGRGSWDGLENILDPSKNPESKPLKLDWERSIVLDESGNVIMYYGTHMMNMPMGMFMMPSDVERIPLRANGKVIGLLMMEKRPVPLPLLRTLGVMNPIFIAAGLLTLFAVMIGVLLMRRLVNPLAEVIAAAEKVAAGDLSTRVNLGPSNDDLRMLAERFNHMTETLDKHAAERRALLADVAHELRTPLSVLRGRLEGMVDGVYPSNEANISEALEETYLLERLVDDLRLLTLAESRQLLFEIQNVDLVELVKKTANMFEPDAKSRNISLTVQADEYPLDTKVDPQRVEQIVGNLLDNALRYTRENGNISMRLKKINKQIELSILDDGPGVKEDELPFLFNRFWRGDKARSRSSGGAGLGLAICKQLVEAQGGSIHATNQISGGLQITVSFPASM